jgi:hypothetical protein
MPSEKLPLSVATLEFIPKERHGDFDRGFDGLYTRVRMPMSDAAFYDVAEIATRQIDFYDPEAGPDHPQAEMLAAVADEMKKAEAQIAAEKKAAEDARIARLTSQIRGGR